MEEKRTYGYVRVSSADQNEERQMAAMLKIAVPSENIYLDKLSGKNLYRAQQDGICAGNIRKKNIFI